MTCKPALVPAHFFDFSLFSAKFIEKFVDHPHYLFFFFFNFHCPSFMRNFGFFSHPYSDSALGSVTRGYLFSKGAVIL